MTRSDSTESGANGTASTPRANTQPAAPMEPIYAASIVLTMHFACWSPVSRSWMCQSWSCDFEARTLDDHVAHVARKLLDAGLIGGAA